MVMWHAVVIPIGHVTIPKTVGRVAIARAVRVWIVDRAVAIVRRRCAAGNHQRRCEGNDRKRAVHALLDRELSAMFVISIFSRYSQ